MKEESETEPPETPESPGAVNPAAPADDGEDSGEEEAQDLLESGPKAGNRAGALAFLAFLLIAGAVVHFHLQERGGGSFLMRLDSSLIQHAELTLKSNDSGGRLAIAPSWPLGLYRRLREDIAVYAALAAAAAYVWSLSARSRARREAFLVHEKLEGELRALRKRLDRIDGGEYTGGNGAGEEKGHQ